MKPQIPVRKKCFTSLIQLIATLLLLLLPSKGQAGMYSEMCIDEAEAAYEDVMVNQLNHDFPITSLFMDESGKGGFLSAKVKGRNEENTGDIEVEVKFINKTCIITVTATPDGGSPGVTFFSGFELPGKNATEFKKWMNQVARYLIKDDPTILTVFVTSRKFTGDLTTEASKLLKKGSTLR